MTIVSDLDISFIVSQSENVIRIQSAKQSWTTCRNKTYKSLNHLSFPESRDKNGQRHFFFYKFNYLDVSCDSILFFEWMVSLRICFNPHPLSPFKFLQFPGPTGQPFFLHNGQWLLDLLRPFYSVFISLTVIWSDHEMAIEFDWRSLRLPGSYVERWILIDNFTVKEYDKRITRTIRKCLRCKK